MACLLHLYWRHKQSRRDELVELTSLAGVAPSAVPVIICPDSMSALPAGFGARKPFICVCATGDSRKKRAAAAEAAAAAGDQQPTAPAAPADADEEGLVYDEFEPLALAQHAARPSRKFETFDAALDEFFSKVPPLFALISCSCNRQGPVVWMMLKGSGPVRKWSWKM